MAADGAGLADVTPYIDIDRRSCLRLTYNLAQTTTGGTVHDESAGDPTWHAGRACEAGQCVEIAALGETVMVRSSIKPDSILKVTRAEWQEFLAGAKEGLFDHL